MLSRKAEIYLLVDTNTNPEKTKLSLKKLLQPDKQKYKITIAEIGFLAASKAKSTSEERIDDG